MSKKTSAKDSTFSANNRPSAERICKGDKKLPQMVPCFVVFPSFTDAFPAVFLVLHLFVCPSLSRKYDFNFPAALGETAGKASEEVY